MAEEGDLRAQDDRIDQGQARVVASVQEMTAQRGGTAVVMRDDIRRLDAPVVEQGGEHAVLDAERDVALLLRRMAIAQEIEAIDRAMGRQQRRDPMPGVHGEGRAVHEHERRPLPSIRYATLRPSNETLLRSVSLAMALSF